MPLVETIVGEYAKFYGGREFLPAVCNDKVAYFLHPKEVHAKKKDELLSKNFFSKETNLLKLCEQILGMEKKFHCTDQEEVGNKIKKMCGLPWEPNPKGWKKLEDVSKHILEEGRERNERIKMDPIQEATQF